MKFIFITLTMAITTLSVKAQVTYSPYSNSNVGEITIKKISITDYYTIVDFKLYTTKKDYSFFFHRNMYIQKSNDIYGEKYYVRAFDNNTLHKKYTADPYTTYDLQLKFDKIPKGMTSINIIEPYTEGYNAWYWKNISINNPGYAYSSYSSNSSLSNFFKYQGVATLAGLAHPSNTYEYGTYVVNSDHAIVEIFYADNLYTKLKIDITNGMFTGIEVMRDNDFPAPFFLISLLKEFADEAMKNSENKNETKSRLEEELGKLYYDFNGVDISLFVLNLEWMDY